MARFYGEIGYGESVETPVGSGVFADRITEFPYFGDIVKISSQSRDGQGLNNDISVNNSISIVADEYAILHFSKIRYVRWDSNLWSVTSVEVRSPRLILNLGSVYNGPTP